MWFHRVTTSSECDFLAELDDASNANAWVASTNIWSASPEVRSLDLATTQPLPDIVGPLPPTATRDEVERHHSALAVLVAEVLLASCAVALPPDVSDTQSSTTAVREYIIRVMLPRFAQLTTVTGCDLTHTTCATGQERLTNDFTDLERPLASYAKVRLLSDFNFIHNSMLTCI